MYWALTTDLVDTRGFVFEQVLADIQTLNQWARAARLEVTAISLAAYPFVQEDYALLPHGASIGSGYGPDRGRPGRRSRGDCAAGDRRPRRDDDGVPRASPRARRRPLPGDAVRRDPGRGRVRPRRRRAADPRGPAHVRRLRPLQGARPRRVVAPRDRAAASARRQRRPPGPRRRLHDVSEVLREAIRAGSTTGPTRSSTRSSSGAASTRRSPTASSRCT